MYNFSNLTENNTLFLIIDIQEKLLNAVFNKELVEKKSKILAKSLSILEIPTIITEQYPQGLGETISSIKENMGDNASFYIKTNFNALNDEKLFEELKQAGRKNIIVMGIETHICVYQTVVALLQHGFDVTVISDACGSRSPEEYHGGLLTMKEYGAKIKSTEMVLFEILKTARHPKFKEIQALIK